MPNFLELLRLQNIFNPPVVYGNDLPSQGGITGNMPLPEPNFGDIFAPKKSPMDVSFGPLPNPIGGGSPPTTMPNPIGAPTNPQPMAGGGADRIKQLMTELYTPEEEASGRFNELLAQYPKREEYKPGALRRIGAMLATLAGSVTKDGLLLNENAMNMGQDILNRPYNEKLAEWKAQVEPAYQSANLERYSNTNERGYAYQTTMAQLKAEADAARAANDTRKADIAEARLRAYDFKMRNPNFKFDFSGPTVIVANPATGELKDSGIPTGALSDADKMSLQQENALERIGATGEQARLTEGVRQEGREGLAETRGWQIFNIPDPANPGQMKAVKINQITGEVLDVGQRGMNQAATGMEAAGTGAAVTKPGVAGTGQPNPQQLQAIQQKAAETLQSLDELQDEATGKLTPIGQRSVGLSSFGNIIPASKGYAGSASIKRLKSLLIVDLIAEMKAQSRTGATGFGQLNMKELGVLESAATKLDPALDEATFNAELSRIREKLKKILQPSDGFNPVTAPTSKPTAADLIKKYSGGR